MVTRRMRNALPPPRKLLCYRVKISRLHIEGEKQKKKKEEEEKKKKRKRKRWSQREEKILFKKQNPNLLKKLDQKGGMRGVIHLSLRKGESVKRDC